jgi:hypothetical protein
VRVESRVFPTSTTVFEELAGSAEMLVPELELVARRDCWGVKLVTLLQVERQIVDYLLSYPYALREALKEPFLLQSKSLPRCRKRNR